MELNRLTLGADVQGKRLAACYDPFLDEIEVEWGGRYFEALTGDVQRALYEAAVGHVRDLARLLVDTKRLTRREAATRTRKALQNLQLMPQH
uniref:Uncharacterized protein n=1 Tax=Pseudomonas phage HRDY3 TaxID=3236930 RepID=A0AB39CDT2_9VIRU